MKNPNDETMKPAYPLGGGAENAAPARGAPEAAPDARKPVPDAAPADPPGAGSEQSPSADP